MSCFKCPKTFKSASALPKHLLTHLPQHLWPFQCPFCDKFMQDKTDIPKHWRTHQHRDDPRVPEAGTQAFSDCLAGCEMYNLRRDFSVQNGVPIITERTPPKLANSIRQYMASTGIKPSAAVNNNTKNSKTQVDFVDVNRSLGSSPPSVKKPTRNVKSRKSLPSSDQPKVFARKSLPPVTTPDVEEDDEETNMEILQDFLASKGFPNATQTNISDIETSSSCSLELIGDFVDSANSQYEENHEFSADQGQSMIGKRKKENYAKQSSVKTSIARRKTIETPFATRDHSNSRSQQISKSPLNERLSKSIQDNLRDLHESQKILEDLKSQTPSKQIVSKSSKTNRTATPKNKSLKRKNSPPESVAPSKRRTRSEGSRKNFDEEMKEIISSHGGDLEEDEMFVEAGLMDFEEDSLPDAVKTCPKEVRVSVTRMSFPANVMQQLMSH